ncbi:MAG: EutN/CcmL family microcompartment protein [Planctomycetota bacterium]
MFLARVTGRVVMTTRYPGMEGVRLQWVQPRRTGEPDGAQLVACAAIDSGPGDLVEVVDGREAAVALPTKRLCRWTPPSSWVRRTGRRKRRRPGGPGGIAVMMLADVIGTVVAPVLPAGEGAPTS